MNSELVTAIVSIATAVLGLAALSVILSPKAKTSAVISSAGQSFGGLISVATSPVTGSANMGGFGAGSLSAYG